MEMEINGETWVKKSDIESGKQDTDGLKYVIVRTYSAGVHAGFLSSQDGKQVELLNSRRLWYWKGAASLSQLSQDGVACPEKCKFPCEVPEIILTEAIEIIPCTNKAFESISGVLVWEK